MASKLDRTPLLQDLLLTLFGLLGKAPAEYVPVKCLVGLLEDAGVAEAATRSTLSRLKAKGVVLHRGDRGNAEYAVGTAATEPLLPDDERVFAPERATPQARWGMIIFSVPEAERQDRYRLRSELESLGFGFVASGVAIAPDTVMEQALSRLQGLGLSSYILDFFASPGPLIQSPERLKQNISHWWDLEGLGTKYREFLDDFVPMSNKWARRTDTCSAESFSDYLKLLARWRIFPYRDPNISLELLPRDWLAPQAKGLFLQINARIGQGARSWARAKLPPAANEPPSGR